MVIMMGAWDGVYPDAFKGRRLMVCDVGAVPQLGGLGGPMVN